MHFEELKKNFFFTQKFRKLRPTWVKLTVLRLLKRSLGISKKNLDKTMEKRDTGQKGTVPRKKRPDGHPNYDWVCWKIYDLVSQNFSRIPLKSKTQLQYQITSKLPKISKITQIDIPFHNETNLSILSDRQSYLQQASSQYSLNEKIK